MLQFRLTPGVFYNLIILYVCVCACVLVLTLCEIALWQSVGDVGELAAVVAVLQWAHVHVAPLLELLQPAALLLALAVGVEHHTYPQCTWDEGGEKGVAVRGQDIKEIEVLECCFKSGVLTEWVDPCLF